MAFNGWCLSGFKYKNTPEHRCGKYGTGLKARITWLGTVIDSNLNIIISVCLGFVKLLVLPNTQ